MATSSNLTQRQENSRIQGRRGKIYAVIETGGKQYKVAPGQVIQVERLPVEKGGQVELDKVLLIADQEKVLVGSPLVEGAKVIAEALGDERGGKVIVFKYKSKVRYRRKKGHHQLYTKLAIKEIKLGKGTKRRSRKSEANQNGT